MRPFLKWAGNKYALIERIKLLLPEGKQRLIEPFAGSAAVFLNTDYNTALLADSNSDLINLYRLLQKEGEKFISYCSTLFVPKNNQVRAFYALREEFNYTRNNRRKAALFLYLNRHCYNGLCRYNTKSIFNVPFGRYKKPYFPEKEMLAFNAKAQRAEFRVADFRDIMQEAKPGDVVYCDPPYVPLSPTANFTSYGAGGFGEVEQKALAKLAESLAMRGVSVVISNHDTVFTKSAYRSSTVEMRFDRFEVQRFISSNGNNRGKAREVLALFEAVHV